jgi:hypothetical protein
MAADTDDTDTDAWYEQKSRWMAKWLGPEHDMVMHAIIPYAVGGGLDLYYYPNGIKGTGIATKELCEVKGEGPSNKCFDTYELVMFTRHKLNLDDAYDETTKFGKAHAKINAFLNRLAPYAEQAKLNPDETCEFPKEMETVGGKCLIFDGYPDYSAKYVEEFGLLLAMQIFRSEMEFARERGGGKLIKRLIDAGYYPYSDMDRDPVV